MILYTIPFLAKKCRAKTYAHFTTCVEITSFPINKMLTNDTAVHTIKIYLFCYNFYKIMILMKCFSQFLHRVKQLNEHVKISSPDKVSGRVQIFQNTLVKKVSGHVQIFQNTLVKQYMDVS